MSKVCFNVVCSSIENCEVHCSEAGLSIDRSSSEDSSNIALILGLPVAITKRELEIFMDPFAAALEGMCLLEERKDHSFGPTSFSQYKKMALVFFSDAEQLTSFKELYNNMQLPSYSETAPCLVVQLSELTVQCSEELRATHSHMDHTKSASASVSTSSTPSPLNKVVGSPGRATASKGGGHVHAHSLLQGGVQLLLQRAVHNAHRTKSATSTPRLVSNPHTPRSPTASHNAKIAAAATSSTVSQKVALPTCTVCLRRIRCVSSLAQGLSGANDRMVGRSYTCDARLSYDEMSVLSTGSTSAGAGANDTNKEEVVLKSSGDSSINSSSESTGVRCVVCHTYHTVTVSRSIGATSSNTPFSPLPLPLRLSIYPTTTSAINSGTSSIGSSSYVLPVSGTKLNADSTTATTSTTARTPLLGQCRQCHLSENIWLCLLCGYTGCGRYTSQHAKAHYQHTLHGESGSGGSDSSGDTNTCTSSTSTTTAASHHLSLELASGRIWNYESDTFDYIEDEASHYAAGLGQEPFSPLNTTTTTTAADLSLPPPPSSTSDTTSTTLQDRASPTVCKKFLLPSFLYTGDASSGAGGGGSGGWGGSMYGGHSELLTPSAAASLGLDATTTGKINTLMSQYEHLLEAQLQDQQLYFEKLLARETVRALELSYVGNSNGNSGGNGGGGMGNKKTSSKKLVRGTSSGASGMGNTIVATTNNSNTNTSTSDSAAAEEKKDDSPTPNNTTTTTTTPHSGRYSYLTDTPSFREASTALQNEEVLSYLGEVEALKLEISAVEMQYRSTLESIKGVDEEVRRLKKSNDALIRGQKAQKEKEAELRARAAESKARHEEDLRDLQQQIQDLSFYAKTRKQVQESPLKDEIKQGTLVTHQRRGPAPAVGSNSTSSGSGGGGGSNSNSSNTGGSSGSGGSAKKG